MANLKKSAATGHLLKNSSGHLVNECVSYCNPCFPHEQNSASVVVAGSCLGNEFEESGGIQMTPDTFLYCEAWEHSEWTPDCCFIFANHVDCSEIEGGYPGLCIKYVLIICWDNPGGGNKRFLASMYAGFDDCIQRPDPCDWQVNPDPIFVTTGEIDLECDVDGKLRGTFEMEGQDGGVYFDATGCTATVTL